MVLLLQPAAMLPHRCTAPRTTKMVSAGDAHFSTDADVKCSHRQLEAERL